MMNKTEFIIFGGVDANGNGLRAAEVYNSYHCRWNISPAMIFGSH